MPLILAAGVAAYFLFFKKPAAAASPAATTTEPVLTSNPDPVIVDSGAGTGTMVIQPAPITQPVTAAMSAVSTVAAGERQVLLRDAAEYPFIVSALKIMTSQEILDTYQYFYGYFIQGKTLYRYPDPTHPGDWNTNLYDAIQVIRAKYNIF